MVKHLYFSILDYVLFALTLVATVAIGVYYALKKKPNKSGQLKLPFLPTAISLMASFVSAISLLSFPAEIYSHGATFIWFTAGGCSSVFVTAFVLLPPIYTVKGLSMYRFLEERFNSKILRYYGSILFTVSTLVWDAVALYAPSIALSGVTGIPVWVFNLSVGSVCTLCTSIGGLKAVIWTETFQALIMYGGLIAVAIKGTLAVGGIGSVFDRNREHGRLQGLLNFDPNPFQHMTVWTAYLGGFCIWLGHYGANQLSMQRFRSMPTIRSAQYLILLNIPALLTIYGLIYYMALVMFAYYSECDPIKFGHVDTKDQITVYFMLEIFTDVYGLPGLMLASICSATLSAVSSGIHSLATIAVEDFLKPFYPNLSTSQVMKLTKVIALLYGIIITGLSFLCEPLGGVFAAFIKAFGAMDGPLVGILLLGVLVPWANSIGGSAGVIIGCISALFFFVGSIINGVPYPTLPTSTDQCESNYTNITNTSNGYPNKSAFAYSSHEHRGIYQLSYMMYPLVGIVSVMIFGSIISAATRCCFAKRRKFDLFAIHNNGESMTNILKC